MKKGVKLKSLFSSWFVMNASEVIICLFEEVVARVAGADPPSVSAIPSPVAHAVATLGLPAMPLGWHPER